MIHIKGASLSPGRGLLYLFILGQDEQARGCGVRLACADGRGLTWRVLCLLGTLSTSWSLGLESYFPAYPDPTEPCPVPKHPGQIGIPARLCHVCFPRGCRDLEKSLRDAALALIFAATN